RHTRFDCDWSSDVCSSDLIGLAATLVLSSSSSFAAKEAKFGSEQEAKAMLEKAVTALKDDKAKALAMFNKGEGGFKDRDLYVFRSEERRVGKECRLRASAQ